MEDDKEFLLRQLRSSDADIRADATNRLWQLWFGAAGPEAEQRLMRAERLIERKDFDGAEEALTELIRDYPTFAEGWNRRATLRYLRGEHATSLADCQQVVTLEPNHFGAWHGVGLCLIALRRYPEAVKAFRRALEIQPFAQANQDLLAACLAKLN